MSRARIVYFSHGGGPLPILGDPSHQAMVEFMTALPQRFPKPSAILVVSAHWEEAVTTLQGGAAPGLLYDYYGFPPESYEVTYPAPGAPVLAERVSGLRQEHGIPTRIDAHRGFDHGLFIPLKLMYPEADIPCLQLSLVRGLDPAAHLALGKALRGLAGEDILVAGSGSSFHNLGAFTFGRGDPKDEANDGFQDWLVDTCTGPHSEAERERRLIHWEEAPAARYVHPRSEHLLPVHVCAAMAGGPGETVFDDSIAGKRCVAFLWGAGA